MSAPYSDEGTDDASSQYTSRPSRWPALAMAASWITGILWIVVYYVDPTLPVIGDLGNWNLLVGFALLVLGVVFALILAVTAVVSARRRP
ncbi:cell division protein CrgA [Microtetraspora sp. AC03309]|uniref:cell division protein CrgA n=1 Tax=Microtetraspora sp. AC03309 TaxID=2779376 RepID=UPI001E3CCAB5|nr:cell division protein CrgA [Microtetraspora sp. AC03309]